MCHTSRKFTLKVILELKHRQQTKIKILQNSRQKNRIDKSNNFYRLNVNEYEKLKTKEIYKDYRKADSDIIDAINKEHKEIANKLEIDDRIFKTANRESFCTLKDHKDNFNNNPKVRLLNPTKPELGRVAKIILDNINNAIREKSKSMQWRENLEVINWFKNIENKHKYTFIQFDVDSFYPSISKNTLLKAIEYGRKFINISDEDVDIILAARKNFLVNNGEYWIKKNDGDFDVTMGGFDGAEICELVGLFALSKLEEINEIEAGIYRDDGLGISKLPKREIEHTLKPKLIKMFNDLDLKITVECNLKVVQFLNITLDLNKDRYFVFRKENNEINYIHSKSNHPPNIIKDIPLSINRMLNQLSSDKDMFNNEAPKYQEALNNNGYKHELKFEKS